MISSVQLLTGPTKTRLAAEIIKKCGLRNYLYKNKIFEKIRIVFTDNKLKLNKKIKFAVARKTKFHSFTNIYKLVITNNPFYNSRFFESSFHNKFYSYPVQRLPPA